MKKIIFSLLFGFVSLFSSDISCKNEVKDGVDIILCVYTDVRRSDDRTVIFNWDGPHGDNRLRKFTLPKKQSFIYDYRFLKSRYKGDISINVIDSYYPGKVFSTTFNVDY